MSLVTRLALTSGMYGEPGHMACFDQWDVSRCDTGRILNMLMRLGLFSVL